MDNVGREWKGILGQWNRNSEDMEVESRVAGNEWHSIWLGWSGNQTSYQLSFEHCTIAQKQNPKLNRIHGIKDSFLHHNNNRCLLFT